MDSAAERVWLKRKRKVGERLTEGPGPSTDARAVLHVLCGWLSRGPELPSVSAIAGQLMWDVRKVRGRLDELAGFGLVVREEGAGSSPDRWVPDGATVDRWCAGKWLEFVGQICTAEHGDFASQTVVLRDDFAGQSLAGAGGPAAAAGGTAEDLELELLAEEGRRMLAQAGVGRLRLLMDEVKDEIRKGSTLDDFKHAQHEIAAGPQSGVAWRTAKAILEGRRRRRVAGVENVRMLSDYQREAL